ncbi:MAG: hypothetical protein KatS3mg076_0555 [Candidatus Binatia bacterium]|nr:MAG: hypothetical protein KatS3mg076_0555 [Candidatus Binatia bacterium]
MARGATGLLGKRVDGDRFPDLLLANEGEGSLSVFFHRGGFRFDERRVGFDGSPNLLADYGEKLLVGDRRGLRVVLVTVLPDGALVPEGEFSTRGRPTAAVSGDFDGNGLLGFAVAESGEAGIEVFELEESGFRDPRRIRLPGDPGKLAAGDFNLDGRSDLVVTLPQRDEVLVFRSRGGSFASPLVLPSVPIPSDLVFADDRTLRFSGDGRPDLGVLALGSSTLLAFRGRENPDRPEDIVLELGARFVTGTAPVALAAGQFDADSEGFADWLVANGVGRSLTLFLGRENLSLVGTPAFGVGANPVAFGLADLDGDTHLDLVTVNRGTGTVTVGRNNGGGNFVRPEEVPVLSDPDLLALGDFTEDGLVDLVVGRSAPAEVRLYRNDLGTGFRQVKSLRLPAERLQPTLVRLAAGDLNGNASADLVVADSANGFVLVFLDPLRSDSVHARLPVVGSPSDLLVGDVDGDGRVDVVASSSASGEVTLWTQRPDVSFSPPVSLPTGLAPDRLALGDSDGDGRQDLFVLDREAARVAVFFGAGDGFSGPATLDVGGAPAAFAVADFNLDGFADIAVADAGSDLVSLFLGSAAKTYVPGPELEAGLAPSEILAERIRPVRVPDILVLNPAADQVTMLRNTTSTGLPPLPTATPVPTPASSGGSGCAVGSRSSWWLGWPLVLWTLRQRRRA